MTMEILKVQDLYKTYGKGEAKVEALKKVSLSLDKGEFAAVVGDRFWQKHITELYWSFGHSYFRPHFGRWTRPIFHERGTAHDFPPS